jgi:hypothetical protein
VLANQVLDPDAYAKAYKIARDDGVKLHDLPRAA